MMFIAIPLRKPLQKFWAYFDLQKIPKNLKKNDQKPRKIAIFNNVLM